MRNCESGMEISKALAEKTYKSPKDYFKKLDKLSEECEDLRDQQEKLESSLVGATVLKEDKVDSTPTEDDEDVYMEMIEMREGLKCKEKWLRRFQLNVMSEIQYVDCRNSRLVLSKRYIHGKGWREIAEDLNYTTRHVTNIHGKALRDFKETFPEKFE